MQLVPSVPWPAGVNRSKVSIESDPSNSYTLKNMRITSQGIKRVRGGLRTYYASVDGTPIGVDGTSASVESFSGVRGLYPYQYGEDYKLITITHEGMYYRTIGGVRRIDNSINVIHPVELGQFNKDLLITVIEANTANARKVAKLYRWNGAGAVNIIAEAPTCRFMRTHYNRLIMAGNYQDPTVWYASAPGDIDYWNADTTDPDASGFLAEIPGNRSITAISPSQYNGFYISTVESVHYIQGRSPSEYQHVLVSDGLGNFGHRTLMNIRGTILGWNHSGCYALTDTDRQGGVSSSEIGAGIQDVFLQKVRRDPSLFFSVNNYETGEYLTFMPSIDNPNVTIIIIYNYRQGLWYWYEVNDRMQSGCMWNIGHPPLMLMGNGNSLLTYFQDGQLKDYDGTELETSFEVEATTHRIVLGTVDSEANVTGIGMMLQDNLHNPIELKYWLDRNFQNDISRTVVLQPNPSNRPVLGTTFTLGSNRLSSIDDSVMITSHHGGRGRYGRLQLKADAHTLGDLRMHGMYFIVEEGGTVR